jgi:predicted nuclease of predicted toxin-antitoxin system
MIYLIDNQLPVGLVGHLQTHGLEAIHVSSCGLESSSDQNIWDYAKAHNCVIVSKDEDFFYLSGEDPNGPSLVWVRLGNCRNPVLFAAFDGVLSSLLHAIDSGVKVVEIQ